MVRAVSLKSIRISVRTLMGEKFVTIIPLRRKVKIYSFFRRFRAQRVMN